MARGLDRRRLVRHAAVAVAARLATRGVPAVAAARPATQVRGALRYQLVAAAPAEIQVAQDLIDSEFRRVFPDVSVTVEPAPSNRRDLLLAGMADGTAPDVFDTWRDDVVAYAAHGQVLDLEPLVGRDLPPAEVADFFPWQWADFKLPNGPRFGMPKYVNLMTVWYNRDLFAAAGLALPDDTWDHARYAEAARALTRRVGDRTETWGLYYPAFALDRFAYKVAAWGGHVVDPADDTLAAFGSPEALAAAEWVRALTFDDGANAPRDRLFPTGGGVVATVDAFAAGRVAMVEDGLYPFAIANAVDRRFAWGFAPVPIGPAGRHALGTADGFAVWAGTPNPEAAWELVKFLSGARYQLGLTVLTGYLPNRFSILADWQAICARFYPELAEANLEVATAAMAEGYPTNRTLFRRDAEAQALIGPALERVFAFGDAPVSLLEQVAAEVTARMRA